MGDARARRSCARFGFDRLVNDIARLYHDLLRESR